MNDLAATLAKTAKKLADSLGGIGYFAQGHKGTEENDHLCASVPPCEIKTVAEELANLLQHTNFDSTIHFYEDFLATYNPDLRKSRGVFYTPLPVVNYIVRAVDDILRQEFNLPDGIADRTASILDPATGTGTFLAEVIRCVHARITQRRHSREGGNLDGRVCRLAPRPREDDEHLNIFVVNNLLPRLHGFEIMPVPYLIAHLELTTLLQNLGCPLEEDQRFNIHLTNALATVGCRPPDGNIGDSRPATMVILGNPPYNVSTANREYGKDLIAKYKEGLEHETNIQPLSDDYIKFIALGQHLIEVNEAGGILAYISNNSFLDGVIHRTMRKTLLETFDKIYVLNLHGNTRKKETVPDGSKDENIFHIQQGTSINIFVSHGDTEARRRQESSKVFYADLYGKRVKKFEFLKTQTLDASGFTEFLPTTPDYFFIPKDFSLKAEYDEGFGVNQLFIKQGTGIKFRKDNLLVKNFFTKHDVETMFADMKQLDDEQLLAKYKTTETQDWKLSDKRRYFLNARPEDIVPVLYRVFDMRWTYYPMDKISKIIVRSDARKDLMQHLFRDNLVLLTLRNQPTVQEFDRVFITTGIIEHCVIGRGTYAFPLYWYDEKGEKHLNLNEEIVHGFFSHNGTKTQRGKPSALDIFDYVYGVLHDPKYRARYQEFLKLDFPRIPYPKDAAVFEQYVQVGTRLRKLHLLEEVPEIQTTFPIQGNNAVKDVRFIEGRALINDTQYFEGVPPSVWNFYIGGSCPVQKYLKDRKGRVLSSEEILHYKKIVAVLRETAFVSVHGQPR